MEPELVESGVQNEQSHWRIHVCFVAKMLYVFSTSAGRKALSKGVEVRAYQSDVLTAEGKAVPIEDIDGCKDFPIPSELLEKHAIEQAAGEAEKGRAAEAIVHAWLAGRETSFVQVCDVKTQQKGVDLITLNGIDPLTLPGVRVQVKCDYKGGHEEYGGTGNLFLQTTEANPFHKW